MQNRLKTSNLSRLLAIALLLGLTMVFLAACGGDTGAGASVQPTATVAADTSGAAQPADTPAAQAATDSTPSAPSTDGSGAAVATQPASDQASGSGTQMQAVLKEWSLTLDQSEVPAGPVHFTVTNEGMMAHNFTVLDPSGAEVGRTPTFRGADGAQTLDVTLQPGTYTVECSLPGHAARGQKAQLTVK